MLAPAFVSWAAWMGLLNVQHTPMAFMGLWYVHIIFTILAIGELVADKLPSTPSRKAIGPFIARVVSGALSGATVGASAHALFFLAAFGAVGAIAGTLLGATIRAKLAAIFQRDLYAALLEDASALAIGFFALYALK
jgi:uncharacterized membrane protein